MSVRSRTSSLSVRMCRRCRGNRELNHLQEAFGGDRACEGMEDRPFGDGTVQEGG